MHIRENDDNDDLSLSPLPLFLTLKLVIKSDLDR